MGKSQPSVSRIMSFLEQRIGMPLFEPGRRPLRPTELGSNLARLGARIRAANQEASLLVRRFKQGHAGLLRVGGSPIFMDGVVSMVIADFQSRFPDIHIDQSYGYLEALSASIRNGSLDLAILPVHQNQVPQDMTFVPILSGHNVIVCRPGHPLTNCTEITLADIDAYNWISPPTESPLFRDLQLALKTIGTENFRISFSGGTFASIQSVLTGSDSLAILPASVVFQARRTAPHAILPIRIDHPDRQLGLLTLTDRQGPPALAQFTAFATRELQQLQERMEHEQRTAKSSA